MFAGLVASLILSAQPNPDDGHIIRCVTRICESAVAEVTHLPIRPNRNERTVQHCVAANRTLGEQINRLSYAATMRYNRGEISYDHAADIRAMYYSETYIIRETLRETIRTGDTARCDRILNIGLRVLSRMETLVR